MCRQQLTFIFEFEVVSISFSFAYGESTREYCSELVPSSRSVDARG